MKLETVINVYNTLAELSQVKMPIQGGYKVVKNLKIFEPEFKFFDDKRKELVDTYFVNGRVELDKQVEADKAFNELLNVEVEVTPIKIRLSELGEVQLTPAQLLKLDTLIEE